MRKSSATSSASQNTKRRRKPRTPYSHPISPHYDTDVPECVEFIRRCVEPHGKITDSSLQEAALKGIATLLVAAFQQALQGDKKCGFFFGELTPVLLKKRTRLAEANDTFRRRAAKVEASRPTTTRSSGLRSLVHKIIAETSSKIHRLHILYAEVRHPRLCAGLVEAFKMDKTLLAIPSLDSSPKVVSTWTNDVVYPALRRMAKRGELPWEITNMAKATDENGKFQLSNLRTLIRQTVEREAKLPQLYYFNL